VTCGDRGVQLVRARSANAQRLFEQLLTLGDHVLFPVDAVFGQQDKVRSCRISCTRLCAASDSVLATMTYLVTAPV
jgi:hypothetical protein